MEQYFRHNMKNINMVVPYYLIASYAYYVMDDPIISDALFDEMAKTFYNNYDTIAHRHKHLISKDELKAGTCLLKAYPSIVTGAYDDLIKKP